MAAIAKIELIDDLTGEAIEDGQGGTVTFAVFGRTYEIDLTDSHQAALQESMQEWIDHARKVSTKGRKRRSGRVVAGMSKAPHAVTIIDPPTTEDPAERRARVRAWAQAEGFQIGDRGRISAAINDAYDEAHA